MSDQQAQGDSIARRRAEVLAQLDEVTQQLAELRHQREILHDDDEHDPDGVSLSSEWSRLEGLKQARLEALAAVDEAEARRAAGDYGICRECGQRIPPERLQIRPDALTCVACAT